MLDYQKSFKADFELSFEEVDQVTTEGKTLVVVKVKNKGNLTDVGKVKIFTDGIRNEEIHHYELEPGQEKSILFKLEGSSMKNLMVTSKYKSITKDF